MCMGIGLMRAAQAYFTPELREVSHRTDQGNSKSFKVVFDDLEKEIIYSNF